MSVPCFVRVLKFSTAKGTDRLVLLAIASHAYPDGTGAWPSRRTIAAEARVSEATVKRAVKRIEALGELYVERQRGHSNTYTITLPHEEVDDFADPLEAEVNDLDEWVEEDAEEGAGSGHLDDPGSGHIGDPGWIGGLVTQHDPGHPENGAGRVISAGGRVISDELGSPGGPEGSGHLDDPQAFLEPSSLSHPPEPARAHAREAATCIQCRRAVASPSSEGRCAACHEEWVTEADEAA